MLVRNMVTIIGGTSGVGLALARALHPTYAVTVLGRNSTVLAQLREEGMMTGTFDIMHDEWNPAWHSHIMIFSAGCGTFEAADTLSNASIEQMCRTNIEGPMKVTKPIVQEMKRRGGGHLIYIGSQAGKVATPKASVYAATKHALIGYTNALRMEVKRHHIDVSVVHPGPIDTPFIDEADPTGAYKSSLGRWLLSPETVVEAIVRVIETKAREVNVPHVMGWSSTLYALMPRVVETFGRSFFEKK